MCGGSWSQKKKNNGGVRLGRIKKIKIKIKKVGEIILIQKNWNNIYFVFLYPPALIFHVPSVVADTQVIGNLGLLIQNLG